ncbi:MAG TPA: response regulator [bacterium]|nr:response regulator [bacterium]
MTANFKNTNQEKKVLIIEEDKKIADLYQKKIKALDLKVVVWNKQTDLLKNLKKEMPSLILMNLVFISTNGWEVLKSIKKSKMFTNTPVIIFSQLSQKEDIKKAFHMGVNAYFIKNHNSLAEVSQKIVSLINKQ